MSSSYWKPLSRINSLLVKRSLGTFDTYGKHTFIKAKTVRKESPKLSEEQKKVMNKKVAVYNLEEKKRIFWLSALTLTITSILIFSCIKIIELL